MKGIRIESTEYNNNNNPETETATTGLQAYKPTTETKPQQREMIRLEKRSDPSIKLGLPHTELTPTGSGVE